MKILKLERSINCQCAGFQIQRLFLVRTFLLREILYINIRSLASTIKQQYHESISDIVLCSCLAVIVKFVIVSGQFLTYYFCFFFCVASSCQRWGPSLESLKPIHWHTLQHGFYFLCPKKKKVDIRYSCLSCAFHFLLLIFLLSVHIGWQQHD